MRSKSESGYTRAILLVSARFFLCSLSLLVQAPAKAHDNTATQTLLAQGYEQNSYSREPRNDDGKTRDSQGASGSAAGAYRPDAEDRDMTPRARRFKEMRERTKNDEGSKTQQDTDMPSWKMRQRLMNGGAGNADNDEMPWKQKRENSSGSTPEETGNNTALKRRPAAGALQDGAPEGLRGGYPGRGRMHGQGPFGAQALDLTPLGLSEEQKEKINQTREQTKAKLKDLRKSLTEKQSQMKSLMFNPDSSETQIRAARSDLRKLLDQMDETNMNDLLYIRSMLTPEQKKRLPDCAPGRNISPAMSQGQTSAADSPASPSYSQSSLRNNTGSIQPDAGESNSSKNAEDSGVGRKQRKDKRTLEADNRYSAR